eukprot:GFUD01021540.1.p1 GENE.GFUD01021540.1~~GFUD01021540.1.p1  ORF type:complete len:315 (+),score=65.89 GFUD01021540.1:57-1001(+)
MSYRSKLVKLCKYAAGGSLVTALTVQVLDGERPGVLGNKFAVLAKSNDFSKVNDLYHGTGIKWDSNWDKREPAGTVKPLKDTATDEEKAAHDEKVAANTPKANRIIVMVRHGQYNLEGTQDSERFLTELGKKQADETGQRLALLYSRYLQKLDDNGNDVTNNNVTNNIKLVKSTMTRATETANIILKHLPDIEHSDCDLVREGAPCVPDPPIESWSPDPADFFQEGARIEAGFRKYFHRADPSQESTSVDILVCHGNVIRYCACRALQCDPRAWLRMAVHNGSITVFIIKPSGRVSLLELGGAGHFHPDLLTFN